MLFLTGFIFVSCKRGSTKPTESYDTVSPTKDIDSTSFVARGEYLVKTIGCADCHSPKRITPLGPEIIPELDLSGFPAKSTIPQIDLNSIANGWVMFSPDGTSSIGPWGQSYSANITSDPTGIGNWPKENFIRALRKGKYKGLEGSRDLLPPMPWHFYKNFTDEDLSSIYYYLT